MSNIYGLQTYINETSGRKKVAPKSVSANIAHGDKFNGSEDLYNLIEGILSDINSIELRFSGTGSSNHALSADSADKWSTARTISLTGDVKGSVSLDGSKNVEMSTSIDSLDSSKLKGIIPLSLIPKTALSECKTVTNWADAFTLTTEDVQIGDTIRILSEGNNGKLYLVVDDTKLDSNDGYMPYSVSTHWNDIIDVPTTYTPSDHTHPYLPLTGGTLEGNISFDADRKRSIGSSTSRAYGIYAYNVYADYFHSSQGGYIFYYSGSNTYTDIRFFNDDGPLMDISLGNDAINFSPYPYKTQDTLFVLTAPQRNLYLDGEAKTARKLSSEVTLSFDGKSSDLYGQIKFDGSSNVDCNLTLAPLTTTSESYQSKTLSHGSTFTSESTNVDAKGRVIGKTITTYKLPSASSSSSSGGSSSFISPVKCYKIVGTSSTTANYYRTSVDITEPGLYLLKFDQVNSKLNVYINDYQARYGTMTSAGVESYNYNFGDTVLSYGTSGNNTYINDETRALSPSSLYLAIFNGSVWTIIGEA